ncbi:MAG: alkaline shock response membrane anchor protein AmaP [Alicyclobacillus mali]|uniref:alkaline shock response membrane anchor protein AmaP n=1 Tax=Alicyclobacillus mali (ex Roth et al. 2021) TaxID=1123961 RepID=UPI00082B3894|nr:alkaline shock response membrane anchor protein AmaP [Alicyclobacillus mali (ex Roth et al. 2021)]MCL6489299.1 alkaline shock response membrane anchor protein AmaP [Alicyclobacillus mali (ex Roth et al. 2021)]
MNLFDRLLLFVLSVVALVLGVAVVLVGAAVPIGWAQMELTRHPYNIVTMVVGGVTALIAIRFLFFRRRRDPKLDSVMVAGDHGPIRIAYDTIVQLANRRGSQLKGVASFETVVRQGQGGLVLTLRMRVLPDIDVAALAKEAQNAVKSYLEETTHVPVERVLVQVTELGDNNRSMRVWSGTGA